MLLAATATSGHQQGVDNPLGRKVWQEGLGDQRPHRLDQVVETFVCERLVEVEEPGAAVTPRHG